MCRSTISWRPSRRRRNPRPSSHSTVLLRRHSSRAASQPASSTACAIGAAASWMGASGSGRSEGLGRCAGMAYRTTMRLRFGRYRRKRGASKNWAMRSCQIESRSQARSPTPDRCRRFARRRMPPNRSPKSAESITSRSPSSTSWSNTGCANGGSPGHHTKVGRSWMSSGATTPDRCSAASPRTVRITSS